MRGPRGGRCQAGRAGLLPTGSAAAAGGAGLQEGRQPEHRDVALQKVSDSEKLLYVLEADAAIAKQMKHPQGDMIAEE